MISTHNCQLTLTARCARNYKLRFRFAPLGKGNPLRVPRCIPSDSGAAIGIEPYPHQWGDFTLPKPHQQNGRACPFETCLFRETNPSRFGYAPLHGDQSFRTLNHDKGRLHSPLDPMTKRAFLPLGTQTISWRPQGLFVPLWIPTTNRVPIGCAPWYAPMEMSKKERTSPLKASKARGLHRPKDGALLTN